MPEIVRVLGLWNKNENTSLNHQHPGKRSGAVSTCKPSVWGIEMRISITQLQVWRAILSQRNASGNCTARQCSAGLQMYTGTFTIICTQTHTRIHKSTCTWMQACRHAHTYADTQIWAHTQLHGIHTINKKSLQSCRRDGNFSIGESVHFQVSLCELGLWQLHKVRCFSKTGTWNACGCLPVLQGHLETWHLWPIDKWSFCNFLLFHQKHLVKTSSRRTEQRKIYGLC